MALHLSPITSDQWKSIIKNSILAGLSALVVVLQAQGVSKPALIAGLVSAGTAILKVIEKAFTVG